MSYEPTNWKAGDTVTSAKLNKMEQGISSSGPLVVHITNSSKNGAVSKTMDKTWLQICEAAPNVCFVEEYNDDVYSLENYQLIEIKDSYTVSADGAEASTVISPSVTLFALGSQETFKFITLPTGTSQDNKSSNPVWIMLGTPIGDISNMNPA